MATIEPRLIHLLNGSNTPQLTQNDLPPLNSYSRYSPTADGPLPPLSSDGKHSTHRSERASHTHRSHRRDHEPSYMHSHDDVSLSRRGMESRYDERRYGGSTGYPMHMLLSESDDFSYHTSRFPDDAQDAMDEAANRKRARGLAVKDDFLQLPQPMKKQKAAQQALSMPPIINGLHEPPPHAALFPPIAANSFDDEGDARQPRLFQEHSYTHEERYQHSSPEAEKSVPRARKRAVKPRRKWTEEETNHLLLGVSRHGVGKWTSILEDCDFRFNDRTAGDLKDRFRTCCPDELRGSGRSTNSETSPIQSSKRKPKKGLHSENILIEDDDSITHSNHVSHDDGESAPKQKKSRAHRKKMEDLAELGILGPFKKSHRRERRPFTEQDDCEILEGLDHYGPAWTKIQRDPHYNLSSRQPTDLRDRVRNKYPQVYQRIEKGTFHTKELRNNDTLEPSINMPMGHHSLHRSKPTELAVHTKRANAREESHRWPTQISEAGERDDYHTGYGTAEPSTPYGLGGEMDISRLLLDDSNTQSYPIRLGPVPTPRSTSRTDRSDSHKSRHHGSHKDKDRHEKQRKSRKH